MSSDQLWTQVRSTRSVTINRPYAVVMEYLKDPVRYSQWAVEYFTSPVTKIDEDTYRMQTTMGPRRFRVEADLERGAIDLYITELDKPFSYPLPIRLLRNQDGVDVLFTLAREDVLSDGDWVSSLEMLEKELAVLKHLLEGDRQ